MPLLPWAGKIYSKKVVGPWECEKCKKISQFAEMTPLLNTVFCINTSCMYKRVIHMGKRRIMEPDGSLWEYDPATSRKTRITMQ